MCVANHLAAFGPEADGREIQVNVCSILKADGQIIQALVSLTDPF